jgi:hypothetical protein
MHDGAPAHFSDAVRDVFNITYIGVWVGRGGSNAWPPLETDLNVLDLYLADTKSLVYTAPVDNEEEVHHRIVNACQTIRNYPGFFERMRLSMKRHAQACIQSLGRHFYQFFKMYSFSRNSQI